MLHRMLSCYILEGRCLQLHFLKVQCFVCSFQPKDAWQAPAAHLVQLLSGAQQIQNTCVVERYLTRVC